MTDMMNIDPRVRLILIPIAGAAAVFITGRIPFMILALGVGLLMFFSGAVKTTIKFLLIISGTCMLQTLLEGLKIPSLSILLVTILYVMQRFMLFAMLGASISKTMTVGEVVCTLEKLKVPRQIVIPIAVTLRFMPTIRQEFCYIKDSMRIRGIESDFKGIILHPIRWMEFLLVPLLMRSLKIADELSAAAMVRGIESHREKTLLYDFKLNPLSIGIAITFAGCCFSACIL